MWRRVLAGLGLGEPQRLQLVQARQRLVAVVVPLLEERRRIQLRLLVRLHSLSPSRARFGRRRRPLVPPPAHHLSRALRRARAPHRAPLHLNARLLIASPPPAPRSRTCRMAGC